LTCSGGTCVTGPTCGTKYFSDDFSSSSGGWQLGPTWQIGSATASTCGGSTGNDPATDHTSTSDNGIAGVVIGGCYSTSTTMSTASCLTSPNIDASSASSLYLSFWRHLHTDYPNYVSTTVDVSSNGGTSWSNIYAVQAGVGVNDSQWNYQQYTVTSYKSSTFRVRFCYQVTSTGAFTRGGWNIDDVVVSSSPCQ
jgi:hypothetical protein